MQKDDLAALVKDALKSADGGELFLEEVFSESMTFKDGLLSENSFTSKKGFGLRAFYRQDTVFVSSSDLEDKSIKNALSFIKENAITKKQSENFQKNIEDTKPETESKSLYIQKDPIKDSGLSLEDKISLLKEIYNQVISSDERIKKVIVSLSGSCQKVEIIKKNGIIVNDIRPLCRINICVIATDGKCFERGYHGKGGRYLYDELIKDWRQIAKEAIDQAINNLSAAPSPAGEMTVVLAKGWPGIILHEAIGHGLEADFNMKKTSAFSGLLGTKVASEIVTVVDNGAIKNCRGSINVDDEGTKTGSNTLIENGILKGYMQDTMTSVAMNAKKTGNGRRQSYCHTPIPRMTNTYMMPGKSSAEDIIKSVERGIYAVSFGGGQVDITSGKFVFSSSESYLIENGKITKPIKGATFIGDGPEILKYISAVANDLELDSGVGTCGKEGQNIPVGVGQPTIKVDKITVGGSI